MKKAIQQTAEEIKKMIRFEGAGILGDAGRLLRITQIAMGSYLIFFYFTVRENPPELIVATLLLIGAAFLPAYLWCSGKVQGLPILPIIALKYIPSYIFGWWIYAGAIGFKQGEFKLFFRAVIASITGCFSAAKTRSVISPATCKKLGSLGGRLWY
jgi:hypothetical protein